MKKLDRKLEEMMCFGKAAFETRSLAMMVAKRRRRSNDAFRNQHAYRCRCCGKWHHGRAVAKFAREPRREVTK